jgi:glycosyltransferase 2 family protein
VEPGSRQRAFLERGRAFWNSRWGWGFRWCLGAGILVVVLKQADWPGMQSVLRRTTPWAIMSIVLVALAGHAFGALRFQILCNPSIRLPLSTHLHQYFVGGFLSLALPTSMGGDAARIVMLRNAGGTLGQAATLILTERIVGAFSLLIVAALGAIAAPLPGVVRGGIVAAGIVAALGMTVGFRLVVRLASPIKALERPLETLASVLTQGRLGHILLVSVVYQAAVVLVTVVTALTLGLPVPVSTIFALSPLVWFVTLLPLSVGGLGVREAGFAAVFGWAGVPLEHSVSLSLGTYAGLVAVGIAGGAWLLTRPRVAERPG